MQFSSIPTRDNVNVVEPFLKKWFENVSRDGTILTINWNCEPLRRTPNNLPENSDEPELSSPKTPRSVSTENSIEPELCSPKTLPEMCLSNAKVDNVDFSLDVYNVDFSLDIDSEGLGSCDVQWVLQIRRGRF